MKFQLIPRHEREQAARRFYNACPDRYRDFILWDIAPERRAGFLLDVTVQAGEAWLGIAQGRPLCLVLVQPLCLYSETGVIHLFLSGPPGRFAQPMIAAFLAGTGMRKLVAIVPDAFRGVRKFAMNAGFREVSRLPHASYIYKYDLCRDARLYELTIKRGAPASPEHPRACAGPSVKVDEPASLVKHCGCQVKNVAIP